jgi:ABC-type molybdate transport system substrate-binding protein
MQNSHKVAVQKRTWVVSIASKLATVFLLLAGLQSYAHATDSIYPPWQHGVNNPATNKGLEFTVPEADNLADFHGNLNNPKLVLFYGGNSFFAMAPLVKAFESRHPEYKGQIYFETLPPGLLAKQLSNGGTITVGNMTWTVKPDAYFAGLDAVKQLVRSELLQAPITAYVTNDLAIMVASGNPLHIRGLSDLGRPEVRLAMPNPEFEGVAKQIQSSLAKAGGATLKDTVYGEKVKLGPSLLTQIHHRQTPVFIMNGKVDAGVTWQSEVLFQTQIGNPIEAVNIPASENSTETYAGAMVNGAEHAQAAKDWLSFLTSPQALEILSGYGFKPFSGKLEQP